MTYFYQHLIEIDEVITELDLHDVNAQEREELVNLIHEIVHHHTLNVILNHLPKDQHQKFLERFQASPHDQQLLEYLKSEISADIESEIRSQAAKIKKELLAEIRKSRKK